MTDGPQPWERQPKEGDKPFEGFGIYRDLGPSRTLPRVAEALGKSMVLIQKWSTTWNWVARCSAWDDEADRLQRDRDLVERQKAIQKMRDSHAQLGAAATQVAASILVKHADDPKNPNTNREAMAKASLSDAARLIQVGSTLERLSRGESTERIEIREAQRWVDTFTEVALMYIPQDAQDAFLMDVDAKLGLGVAGAPQAVSADASDPREEG